MTGAEARRRYLDWLAKERRAAANTVEAYGADLGDFLGFLASHLGGEADLDALAALRPADLRAFLAALICIVIGIVIRTVRHCATGRVCQTVWLGRGRIFGGLGYADGIGFLDGSGMLEELGMPNSCCLAARIFSGGWWRDRYGRRPCRSACTLRKNLIPPTSPLPD